MPYRSDLLTASFVSLAAAVILTAVFPRPALGAAPVSSLHLPSASTGASVSPHLAASYAHLPLSFEPNQGQTGMPVKFLSRGAGYTFFLTGEESVLELSKTALPRATLSGKRIPSPEVASTHSSGRVASAILRTRLLNASSQPVVSGEDELPGKSNYFIGKDPSRWRTNVPTYGKVRYRGVYPGIDLLYYGNQRQLEYDFVVSPGASPEKIALEISGARSARVSPGGDLALDTPAGVVKWHKPTVYQIVNGRRESVACRYSLDDVGSAGKRRLGFRVGRYDGTRPLIIDPVLAYSTYLGGSADDGGYAIAVDATGSAYVVGTSYSTDFPTQNPLQTALKGTAAAFVAKLNPTGSALDYSTYLGGSSNDFGYRIAVDSAGNAYVTGFTNSTDFPTHNSLQASLRGTSDAFVAKLSPDGSALVYSTYLGGSSVVGTGGQQEYGLGIAVDSSGSAYVTGITNSTDFPTQNPLQAALKGGVDAFVAKLNPAGSALVYSTYLGGSADEEAGGIAVDSAGNAYVTGYTYSTDFPTQNPLQTALKGSSDEYVAKLNPAGSALVYSTYLGGSSYEAVSGIAIDSSGSAYIIGQTESSDFPTQNPLQTALKGSSDAFVAKLNPNGSTLVYSTYLGGSSDDFGYAIAVDLSDNAYVTGGTDSTDFPVQNPLQPSLEGLNDGFVAKLNATGSALVYSTYLGGNSGRGTISGDDGRGIAVDILGGAYVTGYTHSSDFPTQAPLQAAWKGGYDAFVAKISPPLIAPIITLQPVNQSVISGSVASFTAAASGTPIPTVQWQVSTDSGASFSNISGAISATYSFTAALSDNGRQYRAVFTNSAGSVTSSAATVTVTPVPLPLHTFSGTGWHLISSPYTISQTFASLPATAFAYDPGTQSYVVTPTPPADTFHIGAGYWVYLRTASLDIPGPGTPANTTQPFSVALGQGWNLVGDPFAAPVTLSTISVKDNTGAAMPYTTALANHAVSNLFVYNSSTQSYQLLGSATDTLNPWDGAWIYSQQAGTTLVFNPPAPR